MLMRYTHPELQFTHALPYGAVIHDHGVQFVVFSRSATALRLLLYKTVDDTEPVDVLHLMSLISPLKEDLFLIYDFRSILFY